MFFSIPVIHWFFSFTVFPVTVIGEPPMPLTGRSVSDALPGIPATDALTARRKKSCQTGTEGVRSLYGQNLMQYFRTCLQQKNRHTPAGSHIHVKDIFECMNPFVYNHICLWNIHFISCGHPRIPCIHKQIWSDTKDSLIFCVVQSL